MNEDENLIICFVCSIIISIIVREQILIFCVATIFIIAVDSFLAGELPLWRVKLSGVNQSQIVWR